MLVFNYQLNALHECLITGLVGRLQASKPNSFKNRPNLDRDNRTI